MRSKPSAKASARRGRATVAKKPAGSQPAASLSKPATRTTGLGGTYGSMGMMVDASRAMHIPAPIPLGPYTVVRGRSTIQITTNSAGQRTVLLLGPHTVATIGSRDLTISPVVGVSGVGTDAPGTGETVYSDSVIAPYAASLSGNLANANLHGLTAVINCLSTATAAENQVYFGSLNQRINRSRFTFWNDVADQLINRREVMPHSAYSLLSEPLKLSCYPVDIVDWARQSPLVPRVMTNGDNVTMDSLSQLVFVFPPTVVALNYSITIYTEWRVNFVDAALSSTATTKRASSMDIWSRIAAAGSETAGFVARAETAISTGMKVFNGLQGATSTFARAGMLLGL